MSSKKRNRLLFLGVVVLPMILAVVYYSLFAQQRYVSTAEITVRLTDSTSSPALSDAAGLSLLLGASNPTSREETLFLRQYILSNDMLSILNKELNWLDHYSGNLKDPFYWLAGDASQAEQLDYYRRIVSAYFDIETGLLQVEVQAFEPEYAQQVMQVILQESEKFVNELSLRLTRDQLAFVERELIIARTNYEQKREEMLAFQAENNLLDAQSTIESRGVMIASMEAAIATEKAKLTALRSSLSPSSPQVQQQSRKIQALEQQLVAESQRLIAREGDVNKLNLIAAHFRELSILAKIAEDAYKISLASLENTKIEINKKFRSLAIVVSPNKPDSAIYPTTLYNLAVILIALFILLGIARFVMATIEDHQD